MNQKDRKIISFILLLCISLIRSRSLYDCPSNSPCIGCTKDSWACIEVSPGNHAADQEAALVLHGLKGLTGKNVIRYGVNFHNNTLHYPCTTWCSNVNKLFGIGRGFVPIMDQSCIFGWRKTTSETEIEIFAYGWKNADSPPWKTPHQMPKMINVQVNQNYDFEIIKYPTNCTYTIRSLATQEILAWNFTAQEPQSLGDSYYFPLYFGGSETTSQPVVVSYYKLW